MPTVFHNGLVVTIPATSTIPARTPSGINDIQIHNGHSLTDTYMSGTWPGRLVQAHDLVLTEATINPVNDIRKSTIPGAGMQWRWDNHGIASDVDAFAEMGDAQLHVITESVPLFPPASFQIDTLDPALLWANHTFTAGDGGNGAELMLYATWTEIDAPDEATWRAQLDTDQPRWEEIADYINDNRPQGAPYCYIVPANRVMMRLYDDIQAANTPAGIASIADTMQDGIHPNHIGQYLVTCLMWACIYHRDPVELPDVLVAPDSALTAAQRTYLKTIAKEEAEAYERSGVPPL